MPQRTYTGIDLINYSTFFNDPPGSLTPAAPSTPSQGVGSLFVSGSELGNDPLVCFGDLVLYGELDYSVFPSIPNGALISEIDFSWSANVTEAASGTAIGSEDAYAQCGALILATLGSTSLTDSQLSGLDNDAGLGSRSAALNINENFNNHTIILFDPPITKTELQSIYSTLYILISFPYTSSLGAFGGTTGGSSSITGTVSVSNFNLVITYEDGPSSGMTLTPSGGNVAPGQIIKVTGDGAGDPEQKYFFETEDGIIPVEPQIISDDEAWIEMPYPASDPCFDCFPDCPECDAAFAPCDADFASEACQAALQDCLDCLSGCLEDLELAEECQESTQNPPDTPTVPVALIIGTEFAGNVRLGNFVILYANGSGLYRFEIGQRHDTLYAPNRDGTTYNVKIPNPGGKTGFFRS